MPNRLAGESSPYLLQHKDNPVDWYPWGEEALGWARAEQRPLLVSIGYSACHWCHVMAHESFEDPSVAALMNERFVNVKVDREERPDVDAMCMEAAQAMTGHGGWPLNAFLSPELVPFYAGTYFPPESGRGLPSWRMVLEAVVDAWVERRDQIRTQGAEILRSLSASTLIEPSDEPIRDELIAEAVATIASSYDAENGGFGPAPKFPHASVIELLLTRGERAMSLATLDAMARGGIYDQLGGGFARYSVDASWTVPHFEKMLYDNALLARAYLHGWQVSGDELLRRVCRETLDWALRELRGPEGGFYSSLDADSEGVEGKFYVWSVDQVRDVLGASDGAAQTMEIEQATESDRAREAADAVETDRAREAEQAIEYFGVSRIGNFERGLNVLTANGPEPENLDEIRGKLFAARAQRIRPGLDDKRLTGWNALMISALAEAGAVLGEREYVEAARLCASFVLEELRDPDGRLLRTWNDGRARIDAYLEDHAFLLDALISLYEATFEPRWYEEAVRLADALIDRFEDRERGGFFTTARDDQQLPVRRKDLEDAPIPSGNSAAALALLRLALLSGEARYERHAVGVLRLLFPLASRHPLAFGHLLRAADFYVSPVREVAIVGPEAEAGALVGVVRERFRPHVVLAGGNADGAVGQADGVPLLAGREPVGGHAAAYVCEHFVCQAPVTTPEELQAALSPAAA